MGSLTSRPKLPPVQQPMIITMPSATSVPAVQMPANLQDDKTSDNEADNPVRRRAEGLLSRDRGHLGTVVTGFRGILSPAGGTGRKTLLGE